MKYLLLAALVVGCGEKILPSDFAKAEALCAGMGGWNHIDTMDFSVTCNHRSIYGGDDAKLYVRKPPADPGFVLIPGGYP